MTIDPTLLDERLGAAPDDAALLAADPTAAWGALVHLRRDAASGAAAPTVPDLATLADWADGGDEASVAFYAERSLLIAELLEGTLALGAAPAARRLAAAPGAADRVDPWPARYAGGGWRLVLGLDEAGWLYLAVEAAPPAGPGRGEARLVDVDIAVGLDLSAGAAVGIGSADDLLGGDDFNPVRRIELTADGDTWALDQEAS